MKLLISLCIVTFLGFQTLAAQQTGSSTAAQTTASGTLGAELISLTNEWISAILAKDRSKLDRLMAPDFALHGWDGSWHVERSLWMDNLQSYDIAEYRHSGIVPHIYGDVAAITSKWYWRGTRGRTEKKPVEEHGYVVDIWRRTHGRWQVVSRMTIIMAGPEEPATKAP